MVSYFLRRSDMKNKNWIQTIWNAACAPFVVMGMAFGIYGFVIPESDVSKVVRYKVVGFYYTLDTTFAILRVAIFALLGYTMHQLVFSKMSAVPKKSHADVSSSAISEDLMQLMGWSALATSLSYGIFRLIIEAMEGGMSFALERVFGAIFFIVFSITMVLMVIPETVRLLKKMGYIKAQLAKGKRAFL